MTKTRQPHFHRVESGKLIRCYHYCRGALTSWQFWLGVTLSFPIEHALWEKLWPFYLLTHLLGL